MIASSTMEVEFEACFETTVHGLWMQNFISRQIVDMIAKPLKIYCETYSNVLNI
jgi:hypothetical protein